MLSPVIALDPRCVASPQWSCEPRSANEGTDVRRPPADSPDNLILPSGVGLPRGMFPDGQLIVFFSRYDIFRRCQIERIALGQARNVTGNPGSAEGSQRLWVRSRHWRDCSLPW